MKFSQLPHTLLMVRPKSFGYNPETAASNAFQKQADPKALTEIRQAAVEEFNQMVDRLMSHDIDVLVVDDKDSGCPDAVFPNNWISFHEDGSIFLYPMMSENRRRERRSDVVDFVRDIFRVDQVVDLTANESRNSFLEGTGSVVFDHPNKTLYACLSPRTDRSVAEDLAKRLSYTPVTFRAYDENKVAIYHTNVLMNIGNGFAVICFDAIPEEDQDHVITSLTASGLKIIAISFAQMSAFAGNMITVQTKGGEPIVLMSETAFQSLIPGQINEITKYAEILPIPIHTIEKYGGGSIRCMIAGIHLPRK